MKKLGMSGVILRAYLRDARQKLAVIAILTIFTLAPCFSAMAQEEGQEDGAFMLEEITVTGSRIRGVKGVGTSVVGLNREDIEMSPRVSVDAIIKELPSIFDLGISETSTGQPGGEKNNTYSSGINIHGIGPYATLILLDGHRVASNGKSVNPGTLPSIGIEHIEVVADGASAIYGSDAIAGVVNIIPRRNFNGVETSFEMGWAADMDPQWQAGAAVGKLWDSGQVMIAYEHAYRGRLNGYDRPYYRADLRPFGGNDYRDTESSPGTIRLNPRDGGTTYAIPEGGVTPETADLLIPGTVNLYDTFAGKDLLPEQEYDNANFTFNQKVNDIEFFADGFYSEREFYSSPGHYSEALTVPSTNAFFVQPPGMTVDSYIIEINMADIPGLSVNDHVGYSKNWGITPGVRMDLPLGFQLEALYTYGESRDFSSYENQPSNRNTQNAALASSDPATALDLYVLGRTTPETIASLLTGFYYAPVENDFQGYEVVVNGPVFNLPGGTVKLAAGYEGQEYDARAGSQDGVYPEPKNIPWSPAITRRVDSGYLELYIPVVGKKNAITGIKRLELTAAVRYDNYSDVGSTTNPKIGFNYSPIDPLMFRGSYGTSFRAPLLYDMLYDRGSFAYRMLYKPLQNPTGGAPIFAYALMGGNDDLEPEEATNWSLGADFNPTEDTGFSLSYFTVEYDKQINSYMSNNSILAIESEFEGMGVIYRGAAAGNYAAYLDADGVEVGRRGWPGGDPHNVTLLIDGRPMNLGLSITQGIDFMISHTLRTDTAGSFRFKLDGTYLTKYEIAYTMNGKKFNLLNEIYNPLRLKARGSVTWGYEPFTTQLAVRYVNSYDNTIVTPVEKIDSYMPVDIIVRFNGENVGWLGSFGTGLSISLEARNAFDEDPPFANVAQNRNGVGGFDSTVADPVGRLIALSVRKKF